MTVMAQRGVTVMTVMTVMGRVMAQKPRSDKGDKGDGVMGGRVSRLRRGEMAFLPGVLIYTYILYVRSPQTIAGRAENMPGGITPSPLSPLSDLRK